MKNPVGVRDSTAKETMKPIQSSLLLLPLLFAAAVPACGEMPSAETNADPSAAEGAADSLTAKTCKNGAVRSCADGGMKGTCAKGHQTCKSGKWSPCSITPTAQDTCEAGNDDTCNGVANEGCTCVDGQASACPGACGVTRTCSHGVWSACSCCPVPVSDQWTAPVTYSSSPWKVVWPPEVSGVVAPTSNSATNLVAFPRDSVLRREPLPGSYVVSFNVVPENDTGFHLDFVGPAGIPYPALRRGSGVDAFIELRGLKYGQSETWQSFGTWNDLDTGHTSTRMTVYVKSTGAELAAVAGNPAVGSGFVSRVGFDPKIFALVSSDQHEYDGSTKLVKVSPIIGCAGLTDGQVDALYKNGRTF